MPRCPAAKYSPDTAARVQRQLRTLCNEPAAGGPERYHLILLRNDARLPYKVAAVAWTRFVGCRQVNERTFHALRAFRDRYV